LEEHNQKLQEKYAEIERNELLYEEFMLKDADYVVMGYGIISRVLKTAVEKLREKNIKIGLLRPITLFPFPKKEIYDLAVKNCKFLVVELSNGQMIDDVRLSVQGKTTVDLYNRMGGVVPSTDEIVKHIQNRYSLSN
jgi:pyruvate/2-oxoacid:ferredoxin oxidoreductase alpha subunit